jgi:hypothetical protein
MAEENGQSTYVVQIYFEDAGHWADAATVEVPPRTKRKTIIEKAFAESGVDAPPLGKTWRVRVLDEESAREIPVGSKQQPPILEIG